MNEHDQLSVEEVLWDALDRLGIQYLYDLWNFKDSWTEDDSKANTLAYSDLKAFCVGEEIKLVEVEIKAILTEKEPLELFSLSWGCKFRLSWN